MLLLSLSTAAIRHSSVTISQYTVVDIDTDSTASHSNYATSEKKFEFGFFGHGILWTNPDGRTYSLFRNTIPFAPSADPFQLLDIENDTLFSPDAFRIIDPSEGEDPTGCFYFTQKYPITTETEISPQQYFLVKTDLDNYAVFRIKYYKIGFVDLKGIEVEYWVQEDGSLDFSSIKSELEAPKNFAFYHSYQMYVNSYMFKWDRVESDSLIDYSLYADSLLFYTTSDTCVEFTFPQLRELFKAAGDENKLEKAGYEGANFHVRARYGESLVESPGSNTIFKKIDYAVNINTQDVKSRKESLTIKNETLRFSKAAPYTVTVFSANGRELAKITGTAPTVSLKSLGLAGGIYQFHAVQAGEELTGKFILK